ncbi:caspase family protein [Myxococcus sp. MxC21-1]|uniref:caspase family protein n=1 Tax=Myxococcus sp. MxC21-1 TaxID=3041439 RepID=UPI002930CBA4|nr:caspase family protein [Myxococcus sp. MxC21-1]WNZ63972.1 caspase family protein [Myxococcus sp. MxC21-1]
MSARGSRVLGALLVLLSVSAASAESRFSISVGHNLGLDSDEPLRWAQQDAERMDAVFGQLGGVPEDRRLLLRGESVSNLQLGLARMRGRIEEARRAGERTLLFFFFSGHGDEASLRLGGEALPLAELQRLLAEVPATVTVAILDACHSGALVRGRSKGLKSAPAFDVSFLRQVGPEGRVFIASAGAYEVAQESDSLRGSFFTHHLISGLRGAADVDGDGRVSLTEAYAHVYHRTLAGSHASTAAVQHPELSSQLAGEGDLFLTTLSRAHARLELPAAVGDSVVLVDERTLHVMAEVAPRAEDPVSVALPSSRYRVQVRRGPQVLYGKVYLPWGEKQRLNPESLEVRTLALHQRKGALLDASTGDFKRRWALGAPRRNWEAGDRRWACCSRARDLEDGGCPSSGASRWAPPGAPRPRRSSSKSRWGCGVAWAWPARWGASGRAPTRALACWGWSSARRARMRSGAGRWGCPRRGRARAREQPSSPRSPPRCR